MTLVEVKKFAEDHNDMSIEDILIEMEMAVDGDGAFKNGSMSAKEICMYTELIRQRLKERDWREMKAPDIKFVSYDGSYPCLCYGVLVLEVNGKRMEFGGDEYLKFWASGGGVSFDENWNELVLPGDWQWSASEYDEKMLPKEIVENKDFVMELFNSNVPQGCCGGCV